MLPPGTTHSSRTDGPCSSPAVYSIRGCATERNLPGLFRHKPSSRVRREQNTLSAPQLLRVRRTSRHRGFVAQSVWADELLSRAYHFVIAAECSCRGPVISVRAFGHQSVACNSRQQFSGSLSVRIVPVDRTSTALSMWFRVWCTGLVVLSHRLRTCAQTICAHLAAGSVSATSQNSLSVSSHLLAHLGIVNPVRMRGGLANL